MQNTLKIGLLFLALILIVTGLGSLIGGTEGLYYGFAISIAMTGIGYWFSGSIAIRSTGAQPMLESDHANVFRITRELCEVMNIPMPKLYIIPAEYTNAFATGRNEHHAIVALTRGIIKHLDESSLRSVIAHELAHIKHRDILIVTVASMFAGAISWIIQLSVLRRDGGNMHPFLQIALLIIGPILGVLIQLAISRSREYLADETAGRATKSPKDLIRALESIHDNTKHTQEPELNPAMAPLFIVNPFSGVDMAHLFSTHPSLEQRRQKLEALSRELGQ